jgi:hypothetical protein
MNRILITVCLLFGLVASANAGTLYSCIDQDGKAVVTNSPQDGMRDCVIKDSQEDFTDRETDEKSNVNKQSGSYGTNVNQGSSGQDKKKCINECYDAKWSCEDVCDEDYKKNSSGREFCKKGCKDSFERCKNNNCNR